MVYFFFNQEKKFFVLLRFTLASVCGIIYKKLSAYGGINMHLKASEDMISFIDRSPTAFHAVASIREMLSDNGFVELLESHKWTLNPGKAYYVCRNGSSIIAFRLGTELEDYSFNIVAAHTDSPCFKLKENAEIHVSDKYTKLNTEGYGGMICSTWLDRPLSIAGRVTVKLPDGAIGTRLLNIDRDLTLIPSVAIHMRRDTNDAAALNKQTDMLPLFAAGCDEGSLKKLICKELAVDEDDILGSDLYLYSREKASVWGLNNEFVSSGRLDDLQCVYAAVTALLEGRNEKSVNMVACFDNEEVGSGTKQGAAGTFLYDICRRISASLGGDEGDYLRAVASSFMFSADNAHAVHPNHPELTDQNNNVYMNMGVVVKSHAGQKYTSDAMSIAVVKELAARADVPLQFFANRSDKSGGSTLGNIAMSQVSVKSVDIGLAQLAMHSVYETAGTKDTEYMISLMRELFSSHITETDCGSVKIEK